MTLSRNLLAGLLASLGTALIAFAMVPFFLRYLGAEAYGLIGFFSLLQALSQLCDFGLASALTRAVPNLRHSTPGALADLIRSVEVVFWGLGTAMGLLVAGTAPLVADHWLQAPTLAADYVAQTLMLMGVAMAFRFVTTVYSAALIGGERMVVVSSINLTSALAASLGALGLLAWLDVGVAGFFAWQAAVAALTTQAMRMAVRRQLGIHGGRFDRDALLKLRRFALGLFAITAVGLLLIWCDKLILSKTLSLADFGLYMLAAGLNNSLYVLVSPVFNVLYPRFSLLVATAEEAKLGALYRLATQLVVSAIFPLVVGFGLVATEVVELWLGDRAAAQTVGPIALLMLLGSALHGVTYITYALLLAHARVRLTLNLHLALLLLLLPLVAFFSIRWGAVGGALSWLTLHVLYLALAWAVTRRKLLVAVQRPWLMRDVLLPVSVSVFTLVAGRAVLHGMTDPASRMMAAAALAVTLAIVLVALTADLRPYLQQRGRHRQWNAS